MEDWELMVLSTDAAAISPKAANELLERAGDVEAPSLPVLPGLETANA